MWFTDDSGELGRLNPLKGIFTGPFGNAGKGAQQYGEASSDPRTLATSGSLYVAGRQQSDPRFHDNSILRIDSRNGHLATRYTGGLHNVVALTVGPDCNIWFIDGPGSQTTAAREPAAGMIGVLERASGKLVQYPLPRGYELPTRGATITPGLVGSGTLFVALQTSLGQEPAFGVITAPAH